MRRFRALAAVLMAGAFVSAARAQADSAVAARGDSVTVHLVDVDLRAAVQSLARYLDRPVLFGNVSNVRVTIETPGPVPRARVLPLLRGVLESQSYLLVTDSAFYRVQQKPAQPEAPPPRPTVHEGPVELFIIRLHHARAADVAASVNALYGHASAIGEIGAMPPTLDQGLRADRIQPGNITTAPGNAPVVGRAAVIVGELTIVPDQRSNSLLVRATAQDFELIQAAVKELDIRPLQVLIQVLIVEMRSDRSLTLGVDAKGGPFTNGNGTT
ncbi:MAG TPA: secretin N-terminal domain-containing protein, partial [Dongiaceae bacterium]|nr:secretin N-terminal domain-containing protein [Dongiaceae bacterium]